MKQHTIQQLRISFGLTQADLAAQAGLTRPQLSRIETGRRQAGPDELARLAEILGCPLESLRQAPGSAKDLLKCFRCEYPRLQPGPHTGESRLGAVRGRFPQLWPLLEPVARREVQFLSQVASDSAGETCWHLLELARGARPVEVALSRVGFDLWPVVDRPDGRPTAHYRRWALVTPDWLLVPQVTLLARWRSRLDALVLLRSPRRRFVNVEIDGPGHDCRFDKDRQLALALPLVRIFEEDFLAYPGLTEILHRQSP